MNKSRGVTLGLLVLALWAGLPLSSFAGGGAREQKVAIKDCPDAVLRTIRAEARNGRILEIEKEASKRCGVTYEAEIRRMDGVTIEVEVAPCGKLLKVEVED